MLERENDLVAIRVERRVTAFELKVVCTISYPGRGEPQEEDPKLMQEPAAV